MDGICAMLTELIQSYRPVAGADILFPSDEKVIGKCPRCGSKIVERSNPHTGRTMHYPVWGSTKRKERSILWLKSNPTRNVSKR